MREEHLQYLACPTCVGDSDILLFEVQKRSGVSIETGTLKCSKCGETYHIVRHVPRFVSSENELLNFGFEWTKHPRIQYDSYNGTNLSEDRFFSETEWPRKLDGDIILEAGCGAGRFTEQAASTGAMVVSMDYSYAVDANYASNGMKGNVLIVQGDIYRMPFKEGCFDRVFCFGVLQHTPSPEEAFLILPRYLKPGGHLAVDVYRKWAGIKRLFDTKYWVRPVTKNLPPEKLYAWVSRYIEWMWPLARLSNRIPYFGIRLNWKLLIADYRGIYPLPDEMLKEWAILDTFDMLSPAYDYPQAIQTVQRWFGDAQLVDIDICTEGGLIIGRATTPS